MKFITNDHGNTTKITGTGYEIDAVSGFINLTEEGKNDE